MGLFYNLKKDIINIIEKNFSDFDCSKITVEPPKDASHGCVSTNAALILSGQAKKNPRELAGEIGEFLKKLDFVEEISIAGPGFINLTLHPSAWQNEIFEILQEKENYGFADLGSRKKINIEFVSANPTGPMHVGHVRNAVYGDVLCKLLEKVNFDVTREYYINDAGGQINILADSAYHRYLEARGEKIGELAEGLYPGDYLIKVGADLYEKYGDSLKKNDPIIKEFTVAQMVELIKKDLSDLGIKFDVFFSEKTLHTEKKIDECFEFLKEKGLIYKGVLEKPKGADVAWEEREQDLFRAKDFGDDTDRALKKSNGDWTYFAADIAYHRDKLSRGFNDLILLLGADHGGYVKRMKAIVKALSDDLAYIDIKLCSLVNLIRNGKQEKISKRSGKLITVQDVVEEIGVDIIRFIMLTRKNDAGLDFDLEKVKEQSKDNPVFYVQYAHTRCSSILRNFGKEIKIDNNLLKLLDSPDDLELIKTISNFPRIIESASNTHEPHRIAFYLQELASAFHSFWNKGNDNENLRFIVEGNEDLTYARMMLAESVKTIIASSLGVFGVKPMERM